MEASGSPRLFGNRQTPTQEDSRMDIVPRLGRPERRDLQRMAHKSGDLPTALRFLIVAHLGLRKTSSEVESALGVARSTVLRTAHRYAEQGLAGLYDKRCR